ARPCFLRSSGGRSMQTSCQAMSLRTTVIVCALFVGFQGVAISGKAFSYDDEAAKSAAAVSQKDNAVTNYVNGCRKKAAKEGNCDKLKKEAAEILKEDL